MKQKLTRSIYIIAAAVLALAVIVTGVLYATASIPFLSRKGWDVNDQGDTRYRDYWGRPLTGWQQIDGNRYCFDSDGIMLTGWLPQNDKIYYLDENGRMQTGWQTVGEKDYYLYDDGTLATGWQVIEGDTYYLGTDGAKRTYWQNLDGGRYYFRSTGKMDTGWLDLEGKRYYLQPDGKMTTGWLDIDGRRYYMGTDGAMHIGWLELDGAKYYLKVNGVMATGWKELGGERYYFDGSGRMTTGWLELDGQMRYFAEDGKLAAEEILAQAVEQTFPFDESCTILVGKDAPVPEDWKAYPIEVEDGWMVDARCYNQFVQMLADCRAAGNETGINSAYRSLQEQQEIWDNRVALYMSEGATEEEATARVAAEVARPGYSEHQLGLAVDIDGFAAHSWMAKNSWKYGFVIRYPEDKQEITGSVYEPWHVRFVGYALAKELYESGLCLEEYYAQI